jgi:tetratricopeptide (TPR) repeat protein
MTGREQREGAQLKTIGLSILVLALLAFQGEAHIPEQRTTRSVSTHPASDGSNAASWCAAHISRGELIQAYFDCDQAVNDDPTNASAFSNRGSLFLLTNDPARAVADFDTALRIAQSDPTLYFNRGLAYSRLGRHVEAIADYTRATLLNPNLAIAYHNRGREHELLGSRDDAIRDYETALRLKPDMNPTRQSLDRLRAGQ